MQVSICDAPRRDAVRCSALLSSTYYFPLTPTPPLLVHSGRRERPSVAGLRKKLIQTPWFATAVAHAT